jgi:hypothetical protein
VIDVVKSAAGFAPVASLVLSLVGIVVLVVFSIFRVYRVFVLYSMYVFVVNGLYFFSSKNIWYVRAKHTI